MYYDYYKAVPRMVCGNKPVEDVVSINFTRMQYT